MICDRRNRLRDMLEHSVACNHVHENGDGGVQSGYDKCIHFFLEGATSCWLPTLGPVEIRRSTIGEERYCVQGGHKLANFSEFKDLSGCRYRACLANGSGDGVAMRRAAGGVRGFDPTVCSVSSCVPDFKPSPCLRCHESRSILHGRLINDGIAASTTTQIHHHNR